MNTKELIDLAEKYDTSSSIRKNAEILGIDRNLAISIEMIKRCLEFVQPVYSQCTDSTQTVDKNDVRTDDKNDVRTDEPEYFKVLDKFFDEIGVDIEDIVRYGEPSEYFVEDIIDKVDVSIDELMQYIKHIKSNN